MAYFIFKKDSANIEGTLFKIAANQSDLNNINFDKNSYTILEDSNENFNNIRLNNKYIVKYTDTNTIVYSDAIVWKQDRNRFKQIINQNRSLINAFLESNPNHPLFSKWNTHFNLLSGLNVDTIIPIDPTKQSTPPVEIYLTKSLEQYIEDTYGNALSTLQLP
jgi:hypothetical protein